MTPLRSLTLSAIGLAVLVVASSRLVAEPCASVGRDSWPDTTLRWRPEFGWPNYTRPTLAVHIPRGDGEIEVGWSRAEYDSVSSLPSEAASSLIEFVHSRGFVMSSRGFLRTTLVRPDYGYECRERDQFMDLIVKEVRKTLRHVRASSESETLKVIFSLVQSLRNDDVPEWCGDWFLGGWMLPPTTARLGGGDCDCKNVLFADLWNRFYGSGVRRARLLEFSVTDSTKHLVVALAVKRPRFENIEYGMLRDTGITYLFCDTTAKGEAPGTLIEPIRTAWRRAFPAFEFVERRTLD